MAMVSEALTARPLEGCGLLVGEPDGHRVIRFEPITNEAASERIYRLDAKEYLSAVMVAEDEGLDIIGVMHSHPATSAVPSEHDTATAAEDLISATWHWVIVSLAAPIPVVRSYRRRGPGLVEEPIRLVESGP
jgi:proteasome lid subunit RPN8/RPN11